MSGVVAPGGDAWAEIVAVGTELTLGAAVDTNSAWISARLSEVGVATLRHVAVPDDVDLIASAIGEAVQRAAVVVVTGGLGPTQDDITREAVAAVAGVALERRADLADQLRAFFASRGREMPENNLVQADLPAGARVLAPVGTAPGFAIAVGGATVYCLPGVPREMEVMVARDVVPEVAERFGARTTVSKTVRTAGLSESAVAETLAPSVDRLASANGPSIAFLASRGETRVRITCRAATREEALALVEPVVDEVVGLLGAGVTGVDDEGVEHAVARQLRRLGLTLACAESVTGGGVSARLVTVPGASDWFRGAMVTYATEAKTALAGVEAALLDREGPVSEAVAAALAAGVRERLEADVGLGIVGVAGPTVQGGQAVGTCCVAVVGPDLVPHARTVSLPGRTRTDVQEFAASVALDYLRRRLAAVG